MRYRKFLNLQKFFTYPSTPKTSQNHLLENKQIFIQVKPINFCPISLENENEKYFSATPHDFYDNSSQKYLSNSKIYFSNCCLGEY